MLKIGLTIFTAMFYNVKDRFNHFTAMLYNVKDRFNHFYSYVL